MTSRDDCKRLQDRAVSPRIGEVIIDVHAHAIPPGFADYLVQKGASIGIQTEDSDRGTRVVYGDRVTAPMRQDLSDLQARIEWMDNAGVDMQVMAGWIDLTGYEIDAVHAVDYSRAHNDSLADYAADHADRFRIIGTVPLQAPKAAAAELEKMMADGFAGIEIATTVRGAALDMAGLDEVWEVAEATGAFILLHPMTPLGGVDLGRYFMENSVGRPAESSITLAGLILSGVFERFPGLKFCSVHGGGFIPFQIGRLDKSFHAKPGLTGKHISRPPSDYLHQLFVDTVVHDPGVLRFLIDSMGADHVLLGTDYPFEMGDLDPVATLRSVPNLEAPDFHAICGGTAHALLS
jgi:aminocarboxymuconate-semialdehyde decarboxylase